MRCANRTAAVFFALFTSPVCAQTTSAPEKVDVDAPGDEITVTASRRDESLSKVPISIVAETQQSLQTRGLRNISDLARATPSLQLRQGGQGSNYVAIRGITSNVGASTTGVYIDDTPIQARAIGAGNATSTTFPVLFDLQRVEVLRGPQGTLFGAGSEGGTLRFIQVEPSLARTSGNARAEIGFTEHGAPSSEFGAAFGGPLASDALGFRVSSYIRRDGGWVDRRPYSGAAGANNENAFETISLRGALTYAPTKDVKITPALLYQDGDSYGSADAWNILSDFDRGHYRTGNEIRERGSDRFFLPSLKIEADLGMATLASSTSYFTRSSTLSADYTAFLAALLTGGRQIGVPSVPGFQGVSVFDQHQKTFTQELRLQNNDTGGRLTWVLGVFYQHARQSVNQTVYATEADAAVLALTGRTTLQRYGRGLLPGRVFAATSDTALDKQIAGFGQADFQLLSWLKLTAGIRAARTIFEFGNSGNGPLNGGATATAGKQSESPVTPKFGISIVPGPNSLIYATAAKGFRTGGANPNISTAVCATELAAIGFQAAPTSYRSDSVWSYEVGVKQKVFGSRLRISGSAFYIDWSNIQQRVSLACGFSFTSNLGSAVSKGGDLQLELSPLEGLSLSASAAYTHATNRETVLGGVTNAATGARSTIVSRGDRLPTPPWTVTLGANYEFALASKDFYARIDYNYASSYQFLPRSPAVSYDAALYRADQSNYVNMRLGSRFGGIDLSLFVNNLLDSTDVVRRTHVNRNAVMVRELTLRPRTFGLTGSYSF